MHDTPPAKATASQPDAPLQGREAPSPAPEAIEKTSGGPAVAGNDEPISLLIAALGGEGGGVLADWIVAAALRAGLPVQATSVPGVAQRTGSTSYYLEFMRQPAPAGRKPVFALMPVPGRVDIVLASELMEASRTMERGFVTPDRTWLITASHRVLTTLEKMATGDGRFDTDKLRAAARATAHRCIELDLQAIAQRHRTVISAVLFGALAGSGRLPWSRDVDEAIIREGGLGVESSLDGYAEAYAAAHAAANADAARDAANADAPRDTAHADAGRDSANTDAASDAANSDADTVSDAARDASGPVAGLDAMLASARERLFDYQDTAYAGLYETRLARLRAAMDSDGARADAATAAQALLEAARQLALWMSYEDVIRVADLKTRRERMARVRAEAGAGPDDVVRIHEHLKPGLEEIAAIAPRRLGLWLRQRAVREHPIGTRGQGMTLETTSVRGFLMLRLLASMKRWRPISLRFAEEQQAIEGWLQALQVALPRHPGFALSLARMPQLRRGYSDTFERGRDSYERLFEALVRPVREPDDAAAAALAAGLKAAQAMPDAAAPVGGPPRPLMAQPIHWRPRDSTKSTGASSGR
jgi:indolepyruvate ferredoxin oxidoreductase beta subunit